MSTPRPPRGPESFRRRRLLRALRERLARRGERRQPRLSRRKGAAALLSVSAVALTGASDLALEADRAGAQSDAIALLDPTIRRDASLLTVSDAMIEALVEEEGVRTRVYRDVAGYPTVGVGHLVLPEDNLRPGQRIGYDRAMRLLDADLAKAERGVRDLLGGLAVNQNEFDALVDLVFNVGIGNVSPEASPRLNAAIRSGDHEGIARELDYTTAAGRVARGLIDRSERRTRIFLEADYADPRTA
ncbi:MAG: lysozyme [Erythrobacter sp.]|nr:lysozyme [Erythrobacter sp.]